MKHESVDLPVTQCLSCLRGWRRETAQVKTGVVCPSVSLSQLILEGWAFLVPKKEAGSFGERKGELGNVDV